MVILVTSCLVLPYSGGNGHHYLVDDSGLILVPRGQ